MSLGSECISVAEGAYAASVSSRFRAGKSLLSAGRNPGLLRNPVISLLSNGALAAASTPACGRAFERPKRIAVLLESSRAFGRGVLNGLAECLRNHQRWLVYYQEGGLGEMIPSWFDAWQGDGIIARIDDRCMAAALAQKQIPVVDVLGACSVPGVPVVKSDNVEIARLAAEHLVSHGFRSFAYCGYEGAHYSMERRDAFVRFIQEAGFQCRIFDAREPRLAGIRRQEQYGWAHEQNLIEWLRRLPRPTGVMACNDARGHQLLNAAGLINAAVPDEIAVLGVDNHETVCELSVPPLSSVEHNTRRIAGEAVRLLEDMMLGHCPPGTPVLVKPCRVVVRGSTDVIAVPDRNLQQAVRYIREKAIIGIGIGVAEVARTAGLSRRELERRFLAAFGHSPGREILNARIRAIKSLLTETNWPLYRIADMAGFAHPEYLSVAFKRHTGMTPRSYRLQVSRMS